MAYTVINKPSSYFNTITYTGTGATNSLTGVNFKPDWVWIKQRSSTTWHNLYDINRGVTKSLASNDTSAEDTRTTGLTSFNTDGFTVGTDANANGSSNTYVAWNWLAANSTATNTSGTITSTVSVNTTSGFSVVTYTGNGTNGATVGHGLGVTPKFIIVKNRGTTGAWQVFAQAASTDMKNKYITLNTTNALSGGVDPSVWSGNNPTSSVFYIGTSGDVNTNSGTYIAYCFADIKGFSKFGSYTGNGSADGTFVYTGFKPAFVLVKVTSTADDWNLIDNKRDPSNEGSELVLYPNSSAADTAATRFDMLSNGFKMRTTNVSCNSAGATYIYMAFAENPFVSATGIPATAR